MAADCLALEQEELDRKTDHQGLMQAETVQTSALTKAIEEKAIR